MFEFTGVWSTPADVAIRKLDIHILAAQLTFLKVLAEGFDPMAKDTGNGLQIISELCETRAKDFNCLQMEDEAELLIHLKDSLISIEKNEEGYENRNRCGDISRLHLFYKIEAAKIIIERLIEGLENKLNSHPFRCCEVADTPR